MMEGWRRVGEMGGRKKRMCGGRCHNVGGVRVKLRFGCV